MAVVISPKVSETYSVTLPATYWGMGIHTISKRDGVYIIDGVVTEEHKIRQIISDLEELLRR